QPLTRSSRSARLPIASSAARRQWALADRSESVNAEHKRIAKDRKAILESMTKEHKCLKRLELARARRRRTRAHACSRPPPTNTRACVTQWIGLERDREVQNWGFDISGSRYLLIAPWMPS